MRENLNLSEGEARFIRELIKNRVPFMIVGLSAANLQGAVAVTQDIDLWFKDVEHPGIRRALKRVDGTYVPSIDLNPPMFAGDNVRMFDIVLTMHGLDDFDTELAKAVEVPLGRYKVKVLALDRIIQSKAVLNREKDRLVLRMLKDALIASRKGKKVGKGRA